MTVTPRGGWHDQQTVTVHGTGFSAHEGLIVTECADKGRATGPADCDLASIRSVVSDAHGHVETTFTVHVGPFGLSSVVCIGPRRVGCILGISQAKLDPTESASAVVTFAPPVPGGPQPDLARPWSVGLLGDAGFGVLPVLIALGPLGWAWRRRPGRPAPPTWWIQAGAATLLIATLTGQGYFVVLAATEGHLTNIAGQVAYALMLIPTDLLWGLTWAMAVVAGRRRGVWGVATGGIAAAGLIVLGDALWQARFGQPAVDLAPHAEGGGTIWWGISIVGGTAGVLSIAGLVGLARDGRRRQEAATPAVRPRRSRA